MVTYICSFKRQEMFMPVSDGFGEKKALFLWWPSSCKKEIQLALVWYLTNSSYGFFDACRSWKKRLCTEQLFWWILCCIRKHQKRFPHKHRSLFWLLQVPEEEANEDGETKCCVVASLYPSTRTSFHKTASRGTFHVKYPFKDLHLVLEKLAWPWAEKKDQQKWAYTKEVWKNSTWSTPLSVQ